MSDLLEPKPFLKWAGGKRQLLPHLLPLVPPTFGRYYEPFIGGGALFFAIRARGWRGVATLGDANVRLARTYAGVKDDVEDVIDQLQGRPYEKDWYYRKRAENPDKLDNVGCAAWMIYLNKAGFNGLYRVNKSGGFNVPFGRYDNPTICDAEGLRAASKALERTKIVSGDFQRTVRDAKRGDLVYFDPPYIPVSATADFTGYTEGGFGDDEQVRLRNLALLLKKCGVHVILSNADCGRARALYDDKHSPFKLQRVEARRAINSKSSSRGAVGELIIT